MKALRYIISGGSGAVVNLGSMYVLTDVFHVWYLAASVAAFLVSFVVSFTLQRFWTFGYTSTDKLGKHATLYLGVALSNLLFNTAIVFMLVEYLSAGHLFAQFIAGGVVAVWSYVLYQRLVFTTT